jgi:hypothetical protein
MLDKANRLNALVKEAAADDRLFTTAYAMRASAVLHEKSAGASLPEGKKAIESIWNSYFAVRKMFDLHIDQEWSKHLRSLPFWKRMKAKRNEAEWKRVHRIKLETQAEHEVAEITG